MTGIGWRIFAAGRTLTAAGALSAAVLSAGWAAAQELGVDVFNADRQPLIGFYVAKPDSNRWGANLLEGETVQPGEIITLPIPAGRDACRFDLRLVFADKKSRIDRKVALCELDTYMTAVE